MFGILENWSVRRGGHLGAVVTTRDRLYVESTFHKLSGWCYQSKLSTIFTTQKNITVSG